MDTNKEHPLVLRVMRLTKPTIFSPPQVYSESADLNSICNNDSVDTVSYTHLTLPTILRV